MRILNIPERIAMKTPVRAVIAAAATAAALSSGVGAATADTVPPPVVTATASPDYTGIYFSVALPGGAVGSADCSVTARNDAPPEDIKSGRIMVSSQTPLNSAFGDLTTGANYTVTFLCSNQYAVDSYRPVLLTTQEIKVSLVKPVTPPPTIPSGLFNFGS
jgi:hypothetical protein